MNIRLNSSYMVTLLAVFIFGLTSTIMTAHMMVASVNYFCLLIGFTYRKKSQTIHARMMTLGIVSDLLLVLALQIERHAMQTALAFKLSPLNQAHIFCSSLATALYFPMLFLGWKLYRGQLGARREAVLMRHKKLGYLTLIFRSLGYLLMFSMLGNHP